MVRVAIVFLVGLGVIGGALYMAAPMVKLIIGSF
jgi:hypothetical protein